MPTLSYRESVDYLTSLSRLGIKLGLERMRLLAQAIGNPQSSFDSIHVVGTNGKTSTVKMTAKILSSHGYRVGNYCSPHISGFCERIQVQSENVCEREFADVVGQVAEAACDVEKKHLKGDRVTQFELLTAVAFEVFRRHRVDVAVVEAGLGGRYDATHILRSKLQALTNISLEHTQWLGSTEGEICEEKLAVVPDAGHLVTGELSTEAADRVIEAARVRDLKLDRASVDFSWSIDGERLSVEAKASYRDLLLGPRGTFQRDNFALATAVAEAYNNGLSERAVRKAATEVKLPGRLEMIASDPITVIDGAHNPAAMRALRRSIDELIGDRELIAVISVLDDKDVPAILRELLPRCGGVVCTQSGHERSVSAGALRDLCLNHGFENTYLEEQPQIAVEFAQNRAGGDAAVLVCGSIYLLADLEESKISQLGGLKTAA